MAVGAAVKPEGECTIIPFRQRHSRALLDCEGLARDSGPEDLAEQEPFEESDEVPVVCVPWFEGVGPRPRQASPPVPRWLRTLLLIAVSTIYAAMAMAVCLSLG
jgi:hypothetical protein